MTGIRDATPADIGAIVAMGERFFQTARWPDPMQWDGASFAISIHALINSEVEGGIVVAGESPIGMGAFVLFPVYFNGAQKIAQEIFMWADVGYRDGIGMSLLDAMESRARAKGAYLFMQSALAGQRDEALARLYQRRGYQAAERTFIKVLT